MKSQSRITGGSIETLGHETVKGLERLGSVDIYEIREKGTSRFSFLYVADTGNVYKCDEREKRDAGEATLRSDLNGLLEENDNYLAFAILDFEPIYNLTITGLAARRVGSADIYTGRNSGGKSDLEDCKIPDGMPMPIEV